MWGESPNARQLPPLTKGQTLALVVVLIGALAARVFVCFFSGLPVFNPDSYVYFEMADGILSGAPISSFPNGFPLLVAGLKWLVGEPHVVGALLTVNILFSTLAVLMVFILARHIVGVGFSLAAAVLVAFLPNQLNYLRQLLSEVPATFFLLLGLVVLIRCRTMLAPVSGFFLFLAGMIRSTLAPLGFVHAGYLLVVGQRKRAALLIAGLAAGFLLTGVLYTAQVIRPPGNFGSNLLISIGADSSAGVDFSTSSFSPAQRAAPLSTYIRFATQKPGEFIAQRLDSLWELWGPWPNSGDRQAPRSTLSRVLIGIRFPLLILSILALSFRANEPAVVLCALAIALITLTHAAFFSTARFTYPVEPLVAVLAVTGAHDTLERLMAGRRRPSSNSLPIRQ